MPIEVYPKDCLEEGYKPIAVQEPSDFDTVKGLSFQASHGQLRKPSHYKWHVKNGVPRAEPFSTLDRERMMGFPDGYVSVPVESYFISECGAGNLAREYLYGKGDMKPFTLKPEYAQQGFTCTEYAWRCLGNSWNVPTIHYLLKSLTDVVEPQRTVTARFYW